MFRLPSVFALLAFFLASVFSVRAEVLFSQYYEGSSFNKWLELRNTSAEPVSLDGYTIVRFFNQNAESWKFDGAISDFSLELNGLSIPGNGFLLIGHPQAATPGYATPDLSSDIPANFNGNDSVVLYDAARGTVGDTAAIVDALSFTDAGNEGANTSFYRVSDDAGYDLDIGTSILDFSAVWAQIGTSEVNDATEDDPFYLDSFESTATETLEVMLTPTTIAEDGGAGLVDVTVTRTGPTGEALDVTLASDDESEAVIPQPDRQIPVGAAEQTFTMAIDAVNDELEDGTQSVVITASALGFTSAATILEVTDDGDVSPLVINELLADPPSGAEEGDANGDGFRDSGDDEFVELVNKSGGDLDLSSWEIHDSSGLRHMFEFGTVLPDECAIVVFGGGSVGALGGSALYQISTVGGLGLNNAGDTVTVFDDSGAVVASVSYGGEGGNNESLTRDPAISGPLVGHATAAGSGGAPFSPGTLADGSEFCPPDGTLTISLSATSMNENGGSLTATVRRTGDPAEALEIGVLIDDETEAVADLAIPGIATIPAGEISVPIVINAVDDVAPEDEPQVVTLRVVAPGYSAATATFEVLDDGDGPFAAVVINEVLADPPSGVDVNRDGTADGSQDEFVELVNVSGMPFDLSGYELHDGFGLRHIFPAGTVLVAERAVVVFGGGAPSGSFGGSIVQAASTGMLGLNNSGDTVTLKTPGGGSDLLQVSFDGSVFDQSITRDPELTGEFVAHSAASEAGGTLLSPGTQASGDFFEGAIEPGTLRIELFEIDFGMEEITVSVSGLQATVEYILDVSLDLGQTDPWFGLQTFTTQDGVEVAPGVHQFVFFDPFIPRETSQYYRVRQP